MSQRKCCEEKPQQLHSIFCPWLTKTPHTNKKPFKINSTRNADVLNKASVVMAAKFWQNEIEASKVHCSKLIIL